MPDFSSRYYSEIYNLFVPRAVKYLEPSSGSRAVKKIVFDLASTCNLGCSYCFASQGHYGSQHFSKVPLLPERAAVEIVDRICEEVDYVGAVKFFGGEPLLNLDGIEAICNRFRHNYESKRILRLPEYNVVSNGTIFSRRVAELLRTHAIRITISVDGDEKTHDTERRFSNNKGSFNVIARNVARLHDSGVRTNIIESVFNVSHIKSGFDIYGVYKYLKEKFENQVDAIVIHPLDQAGLDRTPESPDKDRYIDTMRHNARLSYSRIMLEEVHEGKLGRIDLAMKHLTSSERGQNLCEVGYDTFTIKTDGSVYSCYIFSGNSDFRAPNVLNKEFWDEYYSGVLAGRMRKANRFDSVACNSCAVQATCSHCLSGMSVTGGLDGKLPDIYCEFYLGQIEGFIDALTTLKAEQRLGQMCS